MTCSVQLRDAPYRSVHSKSVGAFAAERERQVDNISGALMFKRIVRAMLGTFVVWGAIWSLRSLPTLRSMLRTTSGVEGPSSFAIIGSWATHFWLHAFAQGAIVGAGFAVLLFVLSRFVKPSRPLTYLRLGLLGALAPIAIGLFVLGPSIGMVGGVVLAGLGASTAMASLAMARKAPCQEITGGSEPSRISAT